jgi:hypothetical protein
MLRMPPVKGKNAVKRPWRPSDGFNGRCSIILVLWGCAVRLSVGCLARVSSQRKLPGVVKDAMEGCGPPGLFMLPIGKEGRGFPSLGAAILHASKKPPPKGAAIVPGALFNIQRGRRCGVGAPPGPPLHSDGPQISRPASRRFERPAAGRPAGTLYPS